MLEGKSETLHCGSMCFTVCGRDEVICDFIRYLKTSANSSIDVRVIAGRDHLGRIKIAITGSTLDQLSFDAFKHKYIDAYYNR